MRGCLGRFGFVIVLQWRECVPDLVILGVGAGWIVEMDPSGGGTAIATLTGRGCAVGAPPTVWSRSFLSPARTLVTEPAYLPHSIFLHLLRFSG